MKKAKVDEMEVPDPGEIPQTEADKAFIESGTEKFGELLLAPYTPDRVIACQSMGMHYGFVDDPGLERFKKSGVYPGMLRDVLNHIWIRSVEDEDVIDAAQRNPKWARKQAEKFGAEHNLLDVQADEFWKARDIFIRAMEAIRISRTEPKPNQKKSIEQKPKA